MQLHALYYFKENIVYRLKKYSSEVFAAIRMRVRLLLCCYASFANASLIRRIASTIFSSDVA